MRSILAAVVDCGATGRDVCCAAGGGGFAFTVAAIRRPPAPHAHSDGGTGGEMHLIEKCRYMVSKYRRRFAVKYAIYL